jgi:indole-3-glycerol phosphate synthase
MENILKQIVARKRERIPCSIPEQGPYIPRRGYFSSMIAQDGVSFICEYKKASPSKGDIRQDLSPEDAVRMYEQGGARALSVVTEEDFFKGELGFIQRVRETVDLPVLRKDFIFEEIQITETACAGADCILLIASVLEDHLDSFVKISHESDLDVLVEVHSKDELDNALNTEADMIGVNNRDLTTFEVSLEITKDLSRYMDRDRIFVSESGISAREDVEYLESCGAAAVLIGETLMKSTDIPRTLNELRGTA